MRRTQQRIDGIEFAAEEEIEISSNSAQTGARTISNPAKREIILRDSLTLLALVLATLVLYAITSFLFRSFETRRAELGKRYATRGQTALSQGHPEAAIASLRVAQSYAPDARSNHLLLAEALAQANHTEEAMNYFLSLRESEPADGFVNLQLARLARKKDETRQSIDYYRASSLGNWQGDAMTLRRQVQLELADYLTQNGQFAAARAEILVADANAPETAELDTLFGDKLLQAKDPVDALDCYQRAARLDRHDVVALFKGGRLAYDMERYATAGKLLALASREEPKSSLTPTDTAQLATLLNNTRRIMQLMLSRDQSGQQRADHLRTAAAIARARFESCSSHFSSKTSSASIPTPAALLSLKSQWQSADGLLRNRSALEKAANQDNLTQLIFDTEIQTAQVCGPPEGDDALLLLLAKRPIAGQGVREIP